MWAHTMLRTSVKRKRMQKRNNRFFMATFYACVAFSCLLNGASTYETSSSKVCPEIETVKNFTVNDYLGSWYETRRNYLQGKNTARCVRGLFNLDENNDLIMTMSENFGYRRKVFYNVTAYVPDQTKPANLKLRHSVESDYLILETDYVTYAVVLTCVKLRLAVWMGLQILTRHVEPLEATIASAINVLKKNGFTTTDLWSTEQIKCVRNS